MIIPLLAKLYGIILEKKLSIWLESEGKWAKGEAGFRRKHSTTDHLVTLRIIMEECRNDKSNLFVALWTLERLLIRYLEITYGIY